MLTNKECHWFLSPSGHMFYVAKIIGRWQFVGQNTFIIKDASKFKELRTYVENVFGFDYLGYM